MLSVRSYWLRLALALSAWLVLYGALVRIQLGAPTALTASTEQFAVAQERIAGQMPRKVLYASGSSGFYGVRCKELSQMIRRPAVNFGLHGGLGLRYLMDRALAASSAGDVIVIGPEWETYSGPRFGEYACDYILARRPAYLKTLPWPAAVQLIIATGPERIFGGVTSAVWNRTRADDPLDQLPSLNDHGDRVLTPLDQKRAERSVVQRSMPIPPWRAPPTDITHDVATFAKACHDAGIALVAVFPPMCVREGFDDATATATENACRDFWSKFGIPVLGSIRQSMHEPEDAFDTPYHLVESAALIHTLKLSCLLVESGVLSE